MNQTKLPGGDNAFNGRRPITRDFGGLLGQVPNTDTAAAFLNWLAYPAVAPDATLIASNPSREFGASSAVTLTYTATAQTNPITSILVDGKAMDTAVLNGTVETSTLPNTSQQFSLTVSDGTLSTSTSAQVNYYYRRFWFQANANLLTESGANLSTLLKSSALSELASGRSQSRSFSLNDDYIYFAWPASFGLGNFTIGGFSYNGFQLREFTFTNQHGVEIPYYLLRTSSKGDIPTEVIVS